MRGGVERRLTESVDVALNLADDIVVINSFDGGDRLFSRRLACVDCGISMPEMTPRAFSFNSPHGACPDCQGLGAIVRLRSAARRAGRIEVARRRRDRAVGAGDRKLVREALQALQPRRSASISTCRSRKLPRKQREVAAVRRRQRQPAASAKQTRRSKGFDCPNLRRRYEEGSWAEQEELEPYRSLRPCPACHGERLKPQSLAVRVKGRTIADYVDLPIAEALRGVRDARS